MIARMLRLYLFRFRWEIAAYWLLSITNSLLLALNDTSRWLSALSSLEVIALVWVTVRMILAEDAFKMNGGWRARPFASFAQHVIPVVFTAAVAFVPLVVRFLVIRRMFANGPEFWNSLLMDSCLPQWITWFSFALVLKLYGLLVLRGVEGRSRIAAWSALVVILLPLTVAVCGGFQNQRNNFGSGGSQREPDELAQGIQRQLPDAVDFIGAWDDPVKSHEVSEAREILKIVPDTRGAASSIGFREARCMIVGVRVRMQVRMLVTDPKIPARLERAIPILRYSNGTYATCQDYRWIRNMVRIPLLSANEWVFSGDFISPLSLPEFDGKPEDLLSGLELLFFEENLSKPAVKTESWRTNFYRNEQPKAAAFHPITMEELFSRFPWSDDDWNKTARPFLVMNATRKDLPLLLDRLEMDNRLMSVFIEKGWTADAMPVLRRLAKERIPMGIECIEELVKERDASLSADLMSVALHHTRGLERLEKALRAQPGFDWRGFALEAWKRQKYSNDWLEPRGEFWIVALWAAREGDFTAFRHTAEHAARGKKWEAEQLAGLVAGRHADLLGWLREHIGSLRFDAAAGRWALP